MRKDNLIVGWHPVAEAVKSGQQFEKVWMSKNSDQQKVRPLISLLEKSSVPYQFVPPEKFNAIKHLAHQGVMARISPVTFMTDSELIENQNEEEISCILILDQITDVRNFGAVCRSAACMGINGIIVPSRGMAPVNEQAIKSSSGAMLNLPLARTDNLKLTIQYLKASGFHIVSCSEKGTKESYERFIRHKTAIVMGSEEKGVSPYILRESHQVVRIPMRGEIDSLNVSVASGVILYEWLRQTDFLQ